MYSPSFGEGSPLPLPPLPAPSEHDQDPSTVNLHRQNWCRPSKVRQVHLPVCCSGKEILESVYALATLLQNISLLSNRLLPNADSSYVYSIKIAFVVKTFWPYICDWCNPDKHSKSIYSLVWPKRDLMHYLDITINNQALIIQLLSDLLPLIRAHHIRYHKEELRTWNPELFRSSLLLYVVFWSLTALRVALLSCFSTVSHRLWRLKRLHLWDVLESSGKSW